MKFKDVKITNFKSIGNAHINLDNRGLILVDGKNLLPSATIDANGAGKSSALSSVFYAIYGELPNGDKADSVINNKVGKNTSVELNFETASGDFKIIRGRKKNVLKLFSGDDELTKGTTKETQELIDELINIPKDVFLSTLYFDGHNSQSFSTLTDKQRKEYLEVLFDVGIYHQAHEQTKLDLVTENNELNLIKTEIQGQEQTLTSLKSNLDRFNKEQQTYTKNLTDMEAEYTGKVSELETVKENAEANKELLDKEIEKNVALFSSMGEENPRLNEVGTTYNNLIKNISALTAEISADKALIKAKSDLINNLSTSERCLVCGNLIDEEHKNKEINKVKEEITPVVLGFKEKVNRLNELELSKEPLENELSTLKEEESSRSERKWKVNSEVNNLRYKLDQLAKGVESAKSEVNASQRLIERFKDSHSGIEESIQQLDKEIASIQNELVGLKKKLDDKVETIANLDKALKAFSDKGIKSHVLDLVTPEMNNTIQGYLSYLTGGTMSVTFSTQAVKSNGEPIDKFDIKVINNGEETTYSSLSSGEQRRLDIAISLTLQDILMRKSNTHSNILIYDELFESLDGVGSESIVELLKSRIPDVSSIFVVTHNDSLKPLFDNTLTVVKDETGISHVENEGIS